MILARSGKLLIVGIDSSNVAQITGGYPLQVQVPPAQGGEAIAEVIVDFAPTLTELVAKWKRDGLLPPDMPFSEPNPTNPRH